MRRTLLAVAAAAAGLLPAAAPADDSVPTDWMRQIRSEPLLTAPSLNAPTAICIVDTGVNLTPDLQGAVTNRIAVGGGDPGDESGHGTHVATFAAGAVNGWGSAGTWPAAKIVSVRVFAPGATSTTANDIAEGVNACEQFPAVRVVNLSIAQATGSNSDWEELEYRLQDLRENGVNVVAGAGNGGGAVERPASLDSVLSVGAVDADGRLCAFTARGSDLDIAAPGCGLAAVDQYGTNTSFAGTSYSTPIVSAALLALRDREKIGAKAAEARLLALADNVDGVSLLRAVDDSTVPEPTHTPATSPEPVAIVAAPAAPAAVTEEPVTRRMRRPAGSARCEESRLTVQVSNRPNRARLELRARRMRAGAKRNRITRRVFECPRTVIARFVTASGWSRWARLTVHRR